MNCRDLEELLSAYTDGELRRTQREFVEEHLAGCSHCQATLADYMKVRQQLTSLRVVPTMPDIKGATMLKIKDTHNRPVPRWIRPALAAIPVVTVLIALLVLQPWSSFPSHQSIIAKAYAANEELLSYRTSSSIAYTHNGETTAQSTEWEYASPDRYRGKMTTDIGTSEFIIIGDKQYVWESDDATGGSQFQIASSGSIHSKEDTLSILNALTKIEKLPDERIAEADCPHLRGEVDMKRQAEQAKAALNSTSPRYEATIKSIDEQMATSKAVVDVWIGKDDYLIRQIKWNGQVIASDGGMDTFSSVVKYYDFNKPITIEPPLDADGKLLPGWQLTEGSAQSPQERTFSCDVSFTISGADPTRQEISFLISIVNVTEETVNNVRV